MTDRVLKFVVDYGLYLVLIACIAAFVLTALVIGQFSKTDFQRRDAIVQECLASERYTKDECIRIAK